MSHHLNQSNFKEDHYHERGHHGSKCNAGELGGMSGQTTTITPHIGPKSLILAPQDIPDISGYQLGFGCQCVRAYNNENPVRNQKIL